MWHLTKVLLDRFVTHCIIRNGFLLCSQTKVSVKLASAVQGVPGRTQKVEFPVVHTSRPKHVLMSHLGHVNL